MSDPITRRIFFGGMGQGAFLALSAGAAGCATRENPASPADPDGTMLGQYFRKMGGMLAAFRANETDSISKAADLALRCTENNGKLYCALSGHLFAMRGGGEIAQDRLGNPQVFIMRNHFSLDTDELKEGDFLLTMNPIEAAKAREKGVVCVGFTSPYFMKGDTPPLAMNENPPPVLQNPEGILLSDVCDVTIECHAPYTDGFLENERLSTRAIPSAGQMTLVFYWSMVGAITKRLAKAGKFPQVAGS